MFTLPETRTTKSKIKTAELVKVQAESEVIPAIKNPVEQAEQALSTAQTRHAGLKPRLATARRQLVETEAKLANSDTDVPSILDAIERQEKIVTRLERELAGSQQQLDAAQKTLNAAVRQVALDRLKNHLEDGAGIGQEIDVWLADGERLAVRLAGWVKIVAQTDCNQKLATTIGELPATLRLFTNEALSPVTRSGRLPDSLKKYSKFSDAFPHPSDGWSRPKP